MEPPVESVSTPEPVGATGRKKLIYRLLFLALLGGSLVLWSQKRAPRTLALVIDLGQALPGELTEVDVVVTRGGRAVARVDRRYQKGAAPERLDLELRATPGEVEVEATLIYPDKAARRTVGAVVLADDQPARLVAK